MIDILNTYESPLGKRPRIFWIVFILYFIIIFIAYLTDIILIAKVGIQEAIADSPFGFILSLIDLAQPIILYGFYRRSKISWSLIPLVQGMYSAIFLKQCYLILASYGFLDLELNIANIISVFFCIGCTSVTLLCFHPRLINYFIITKKLRLIIIICMLIIIIPIFIFFHTY